MNWFERAKEAFAVTRPEHFTNFKHCCECFEHDETLRQYTVDSIGIEQLGNPGWDPITFASIEGKKYFLPALIRITLETMESEFYLEQLLVILEADGDDNEFFQSCNSKQRDFITEFIEYIVNNYASYIDSSVETDKLLRVHEIWSKA